MRPEAKPRKTRTSTFFLVVKHDDHPYAWSSCHHSLKQKKLLFGVGGFGPKEVE